MTKASLYFIGNFRRWWIRLLSNWKRYWIR